MDKRMDAFMTTMMGITMSLVLGTYGVIASGHFTVITLLVSLLISVPLALAIGFVLPVRKVCNKVTQNVKNRFIKSLISALITNVVYVLIITGTLTIVMIGNANRQISKEIAETQNRIQSMEAERSIPEVDMDVEGAIKQMQGKIQGMEQGRPSVVKALPKSLLMSYLISLILSLILEPIYVKIGMKKYGIGPYARSGNRQNF